ncbi:MAG: putative apolipoprotein N-acyltransferase [Pseudomonadota bacterium]
MDLHLPGWLQSLGSLLFLALLIRLYKTPTEWAGWLASGLLLMASLLGFHWIFISLHTYGQMPAIIAGFATLLLAFYVASYGLLAGWLVRRFQLLPLATAGLITLLEWVRGVLFTGFPWLNWGYQQIDSLLAGFAPWLGVYGVVFVTALSAAWLAQGLPRPLLATVFLHLAGGIAGTIPLTQPTGLPLQAALVQTAIPQQMKFDPAHALASEQSVLSLAAVAADPGSRLDLIVLPETALIRPWNQVSASTQEALNRIAQRSGATVITGIPLHDARGWTNSAIALSGADPVGQYTSRYDKHHLVPFGEFIPLGFRWFVDLMDMPLGDFRRGEAVQPPFMVSDQRIGLNICFEDLFGEEIIRPLAADRAERDQPTILLNISNLAWFGNTRALDQHLQIARMRSLETGRPSLRATNTGMTAAIDEKGRVLARLTPQDADLLIAQVQGMSGSTPYIRFGNLIALALAVLSVATSLMLVGLRRSG